MRNAAAATIGAGDQRSRVINAVIGWRKAAGAHKAHTAGISTGLAQHSASSQSQLSRFSRPRKAYKKSAQEKQRRPSLRRTAVSCGELLTLLDLC
jgi:hypothetical protein